MNGPAGVEQLRWRIATTLPIVLDALADESPADRARRMQDVADWIHTEYLRLASPERQRRAS
jgi:hypothetical protein